MGSKDAKVVESTVTVRRQFVVQGEEQDDAEETDQVIDVHKFVTEPANIRFGLGVTMNMGNYESARVDISVSVPCYKEEMREGYAYARQIAETVIADEKQKLKNAKKNPF
jgi:hypothetical protein